MNLAIETQNLSYRAGSFQIAELALHVPAGKVYGFLGPNGSGKTTVIRLLLGLLRPQSGEISVLGKSIPDEAYRALAQVGYVPEQPHLDLTLSVRELLRFHAAFYPTWDENRASELLKAFELDERRPFGKLSKGQKAKVMVLLALAQQPELLVLDEPTEGLDPVIRRDMMDALLQYVSSRGATVFISSHLVHELERFCDWIGVMDGGRLVTQLPMTRFRNGIKRLRVTGAPQELLDTPFIVLARERDSSDSVEVWIVRQWEPAMDDYFIHIGATLHEVGDLDLESGFVELLRAFRKQRMEA